MADNSSGSNDNFRDIDERESRGAGAGGDGRDSDENNNNNNNNRMACGRRFRRMLRCVERTGSSAACTDRINEFLACERAVFMAALHTKAPPPRREPANTANTANTANPQRLMETPTPDVMLADAGSFVKRAVIKQGDACVKLSETIGNPETRQRMYWFAQRMFSEVWKSGEAAGAVASRMWNGEECDDPNCERCRPRENEGKEDGEGK